LIKNTLEKINKHIIHTCIHTYQKKALMEKHVDVIVEIDETTLDTKISV
jgi:hypothetical protein